MQSHQRNMSVICGLVKPEQSRRVLMQAYEMISSHPDARGSANDDLINCIEECYSCAQTCTSCADACLAEDRVQALRQCIRLNLDCADICNITGRIATRCTGSDEEMIRRMLAACAAACQVCAEECERHSEQHEHCRICAESCRGCTEACIEAGGSMAH
jgi:DNA phosphorothioation-dependent restriction protein DptG